MAKSTKDKDRRAVVEEMRKQQQRAEKRRTRTIFIACAVVALVIVGLGAYPLIKQNQAQAGDLETLGVSASQAACQDIVKKDASGSNDHKDVGTPITYQDAPPAFGPHYPQPAGFDRKFYAPSERDELPYYVHNLEHGYNLLWYDETVAKNADQLAAVKAIASKFEGNDLTDKFIALPWTEEDGKAFPDGAHVALTHWYADPSDLSKQEGVWQYCGKPSGEVVAKFVEDYPYTDSPEPNAM
jgi:uncharacterized protein DUF3105